MLVEFECPQCKGHICERWAINGSNLGIRLMYWHMILNPGLALNELVLGQRMPQEMYVCKSCTLLMVDRSYVHCQTCGVFQSGRLWSYKNAFGNWLGLICPSCGAQIPCLWNLTSRFLLALTAPIWYLPVKHHKTKWIGEQHKRIEQGKTNYIDKQSGTPKPINYKRMGLFYGLAMFTFFTLLFPPIVLIATGTFTWNNLIGMVISTGLSGLVPWSIAGFGFAFFMQRRLNKKGDPALHLTFDSHGSVDSSNNPSQHDVPAIEDNSSG
jgi:hypothetical protein